VWIGEVSGRNPEIIPRPENYPGSVTGAVDPKDLRVSDDERAHVLALLEKATGRGLIDISEYAERSAKAVHARTRGDLNTLLMDLPGLQIAGQSVGQAQAATRRSAAPTPGFSGAVEQGPRPHVLELTGWGSRSYRGFWTVPPLIVIGGTGASTRLDFTSAQLESRSVMIEFHNNYGGSADFIVPKGTAVRTEGLQLRGGTIHNKVAPATADGTMTLELTGVKKAGSITVRNPRHGRFAHWF
jgi:hypothetical protein